MWEMDGLVCEAVEMLCEEGESRSFCGLLLSGFAHLIDALRGNLKGSWRLWTAWGKCEIPTRAPPLSWEMMAALADVMVAWDLVDMAILLVVGFVTFLRTDELMTMMKKELTLNACLTRVNIMLPRTKGSSRLGGVVCKDYAPFAQILCRFDAWRQFCSVEFRSIFELLFLKLDKAFRPYSLRRGGATHYCRRTGSMDWTMEAGRWRDSRTARIYVNTGLLELQENRLNREEEQAIRAAANSFELWVAARVG